MNFVYFKSAIGNFGDDLNPWLWPQLIFNNAQEENSAFLGIGSILFNGNKILDAYQDQKKIVFGTGIRPSKDFKSFKTDHTWDIRFLRGPLSAMSLGNKQPYITDAAYALRQLPDFNKYIQCEKKYEISLMPYFGSVQFFDWEGICAKLGYHYISPLSEKGVDFTLREIASSKRLITEAMHGAILADVLRVPWHRYILSTFNRETARVSEFKWMDWLYSMELGYVDATFINFYSRNFLDKVFSKLSADKLKSESLVKGKILTDIYQQLGTPKDYFLSGDTKIQEVDEKIGAELLRFNKEK